MARRFSGALRIAVVWDDARDQYRCGVTWTEGTVQRRMRVFVGRAASSRRAVDHPDEIDAAAHAAISFGNDDERAVGERAAHNGSGWHVGRTREQAWPVVGRSKP